MRNSRVALALSLAAVCLSFPASAEEEAGPPSPAERFRAAAESFPAPGERGAFRFEGKVLIDGLAVGTCELSAEASEDESEKRWRVLDRIALSFGSRAWESSAEALLSRSLAAVRGEERSAVAGKIRIARFTRRETGFRIERRRGEETSEEVVEQRGAAISGLSGLILFCRLLEPGSGEYECAALNADPAEGGDALERVRIRVECPGAWRGGSALLVRAEKGGRKITLAFHPESRALLGLRAELPGGMISEIIPASEEVEPPPLELEPPAENPEEAAMTAFLAFATRDAELFGRIVHWPTLHAQSIPESDREKVPVEEFRRLACARLAADPASQGRDEVLALLRLAAGKLTVDREEGDRATVRFPEVMRGLSMRVGRFDGAWYLVEMPKKGS